MKLVYKNYIQELKEEERKHERELIKEMLDIGIKKRKLKIGENYV